MTKGLMCGIPVSKLFCSVSYAAIAVIAFPHAVSAQSVQPTSENGSESVQPTSENGSEGEAVAASQGLNEIFVTARRRSESANRVPMAITAMSEQRLSDLKIESGEDIGKLTPGLFLSNAGAGQWLQYSIRGVTQSEFADIFEGPIATYVDDTYVPFLAGQVFGTFDLERVEVLKGPQGTQFGKNATGGLVHYIPNKPTEFTEGYVSLEYGRFDKVRAEGAISGSLAEGVTARVALLFDRNDPYLKNIFPSGLAIPIFPGLPEKSKPFGQDLGFQKTVAGRAQIQGEFTDRLTVRLTGSFSELRQGSAPYSSINTPPVFNQFGQQINALFGDQTVPSQIGTIPPVSGRVTAADFARTKGSESDSRDLSLHIDYDLGSSQITAVSSYKKFSKGNVFEFDAGPANFGAIGSQSKGDSFSQEVRISTEIAGIDVVGGAFFITSQGFLDQGILGTTGSGFAGAVVGVSPLLGHILTPDVQNEILTNGVDMLNQTRFKNTDYSAFMQAEIPIKEDLTLSVGGRIIQTEQEFDFVSHGFRNLNDWTVDTAAIGFRKNGGPASTNSEIIIRDWQPEFHGERSKTLWAAKAVLQYQATPDLMLYAGYNRGVKAGAYNQKFPDFTRIDPEFVPYKGETLHAYEGGFKASAFNRKLQLNGSVFYYDYKNYQVFRFTDASGVVFNNDAETYGFELSADFLLSTALRGNVSYAYTHAKVKDVVIADANLVTDSAVIGDVRPAFSPRNQVSGNLVYTVPADVFGGAVSVRFVGDYRSDYFDNIRNFEAARRKGYFMGSTGIAWQNDDGLEFGFDIENVFNKIVIESTVDISGVAGLSQAFYSRPRWWSLRVRKSF